tara:strand:- start:1116 stop:1442 length:327 start_codon:yes stop_codon:yes gene_type:complete
MKQLKKDVHNKFCGHWNQSSIEIGLAEYKELLPTECLHSHPFSEYYVGVSGELDLEIEGITYRLRPDECLMVEAGEKHQVTWVHPELGIKMLVIKERSEPNSKTIHTN